MKVLKKKTLLLLFFKQSLIKRLVDLLVVDLLEEMSLSFNPQFLSDPFKHIGVDNVNIKINDAFSPIAIESGDGFLYVIMPMRNK